MTASILQDSAISDTLAALKTYSNYSTAWCLWDNPQLSPLEAQSQLEGFSQLRPSRLNLTSVRQHLLRGYLTLKLIQDIQVDDRPDFAMTSALWLPVQTYYAVHGFGMAFLAAKHGTNNLPQTHAAFLRTVTDKIVREVFPSPFSAILQNGYKSNPYLEPELINIRDDRIWIDSGFNLAQPNEIARDAHIAQCLDTTRRRLVTERLEKERRKARKPGKKHGVLRRERQIGIARSVPPTTIFDYLYRARIKSNYEDPTMYHEGSSDADELLQLVRSTQILTDMVCAFLAASLWRIADEPAKQELSKEINMNELLQNIGNRVTSASLGA